MYYTYRIFYDGTFLTKNYFQKNYIYFLKHIDLKYYAINI